MQFPGRRQWLDVAAISITRHRNKRRRGDRRIRAADYLQKVKDSESGLALIRP
jgi:hypothetical protein